MSIDPSTEAALQGDVVRPVFIGRFDILNDPLTAWTGHGLYAPSSSGDSALDGYVFTPTDAPVEISDIDQSSSIASPMSLLFPAHKLEEDVLRQVVRDKRQWLGRKAWIWMGFMNAEQNALVGHPLRIYSGYMTNMKIDVSLTQSVARLTIDQDLARSRGGRFRWVDHARIRPGDTASTFVQKLFNRPQGVRGTTGGPSSNPSVGDPRVPHNFTTR